MEKNQKASPITVEHWERKFEKAIHVLLKSGIKSEDLINKIKIENEKNNKTQ